MAQQNSITRPKVNPKPSHQRRGVGCVSMIELILSVMEPNVCPGRGSDCRSSGVVGSSFGLRSAIRSAIGSAIGTPGSDSSAPPDRSFAAACSGRPTSHSSAARLRACATWLLPIVHIAEHDRVGRTGRLAGGHDFAVAHGAIFVLGVDLAPR